MTIEQMKERKKELGFSCAEIARIARLPLATVQKVFSGATKAPRRKTIIALEKVLSEDITYRDESAYQTESEVSDILCVSEAAVKYNSDGKDLFDPNDKSHTVEEYLSLPEDLRVELIDGTFYEMFSPVYEHQELLMSIAMELRTFVKKNKGACKVIPAPFDIQLDEDNKTMVQPDVVVICKKDRINPKRGFGAPDMVVEILSPSTEKKDSTLKLRKYMKAGVREYWIVDPMKKKIIVYTDIGDGIVFPDIYDFTDKVPVHIWDGKCEVDFSQIDTEI